jgi:hypothetical protein
MAHEFKRSACLVPLDATREFDDHARPRPGLGLVAEVRDEAAFSCGASLAWSAGAGWQTLHRVHRQIGIGAPG